MYQEKMMNNNHEDIVTGTRGGGGGGRSNEQIIIRGLKKGPWTAAEDAILTEYVKKHGEGNWNAVQKNSGLARCGKSCRLRWANHLRPNLKKGSFSPDEERIIIELHAKLGNKWARMASQLPGRTDNEIKNYWNTRMKRRQRAGLPLYPQDIQQEAVAFHLQQQQQQKQEQHHQIRSCNSSPSSFTTSLLSPSHSHQKPNYATPFSFYEPINLPLAVSNSSLHNQSPSGFHPQSTDQFKLFSDHNGNSGISFPFSQISPFGSSTPFNESTPVQTHPTNPTSTTLQYNFGSNYGFFGQSNFSFSSMLASGSPYEQSNINVGALMVPTRSLGTELPSTQTPPQSTTTPANSSTNMSCGDHHHHHSKVYPDHLDPHDEFQRNSGLLDAVIVEAGALSSRKDKVRSETYISGPSEKMRRMLEEDDVQVESALKIHHNGDHDHQNQNDDLTSILQLTPNGMKAKTEEAVLEDMNNMDDDLMSLLHNFPATTTPALPEWCPRREDLTNEQGIALRSGSNNNNNNNSSSPLPSTPTALDRTIDDAVCYWKNMPGIC